MSLEIYEITGYRTGIARDGVNFLEPKDSFQNIEDGYVYRQVLQSRKGFKQFSTNLMTGAIPDGTRVMGIFENTHNDGTRESLVCTKQFLYRYNSGTNTYDQIPMGGGAPAGGFGIVSDDEYVSGTTYPFANGDNRFVFCSLGMTDIYQYNPVGAGLVNRYNLAADNPFFVNPPATTFPPAGLLNRAKYVCWFGERINFGYPLISGIPYPQLTLYSGIRNVAGNGDNFSVSGAGDKSAVTYEYMTGQTIAGNYILLNFNQSTWTLELTQDVFNPYFIRRIASPLGTDADFSAVTWNNQTTSIGKTGIIISDGRSSLRTDNKIPYFTAQDINQEEFNLTYGGFDRINGQFLFAYRGDESTLVPLTQDRVLVKNYEEDSWAIYNARFSVFGQTDQGPQLVWNDIYEVNDPSWLTMNTTEEIWNEIGVETGVQKTLAGDNNGYVYELNQDYDDYFTVITGISQAAAAVITTNGIQFEIGDIVFIDGVVGMTEINGLKPTVIAKTATTITVDIDSSLYTPYISDGHVSKEISFYAETVPFNPWRSEGKLVYISHVEFLLNTNTGNLRVDILMDEEQSPFKSNVLLQPSGTLKEREWITVVVNQDANFFTFVMRQQSVSQQVFLTSIRIHCKPADLTTE